MHVEPEHVEPARERVLDQQSRLRRREAELRAVVPRADRLVGVGVDAERDAHEHALDTGGGGDLRLVGRVEDDRRTLRGCLAEERLVLVVAVDDDLVAAEPGRARERELAGRGDVGADPLLAQEAQDGHVGERLRAEGDVPAGRRVAQRPRPRPQRLLAVDDERGAELRRELRCANPTEHELAPLDTCRVREHPEHVRGSARLLTVYAAAAAAA